MIKFKYLSNRRIASFGLKAKIDLLLDMIKDDQIIIIDGKLTSREEAALIRRTMDFLNSDMENFKGIEIASINDNERKRGIKSRIAEFFFKERNGLTLIGPAKIIAELKQHPDMIEINFENTDHKKIRPRK